MRRYTMTTAYGQIQVEEAEMSSHSRLVELYQENTDLFDRIAASPETARRELDPVRRERSFDALQPLVDTGLLVDPVVIDVLGLKA